MAAVNVNPPELNAKDLKRFWEKIDKSPGHGPKGDCWKWTSGLTHGDYGGFGTYKGPQGNKRKRKDLAHRISFFLATGTWPVLYVCHECDWPLCCNPAHLFEGTAKDNYDNAATKGRETRGERVGTSKLTEAQVLEIRRLRAMGIKQSVIAEQFNIDRSHVSLITGKRKSWSHI